MAEQQDRIRVWNEETSKMIAPVTIQEMIRNTHNLAFIHQEPIPPEADPYGHLVFMRNTGVFAQSRKEYVDSARYEIFAEDLITHSIEPYVYRVVQKRGCWFAESLWPAYTNTRLLCRIFHPTIVGNVFENRELLMKGEIIDG